MVNLRPGLELDHLQALLTMDRDGADLPVIASRPRPDRAVILRVSLDRVVPSRQVLEVGQVGEDRGRSTVDRDRVGEPHLRCPYRALPSRRSAAVGSWPARMTSPGIRSARASTLLGGAGELAAVADTGKLAPREQRGVVGEVAHQQQRWQRPPPDEQ